MHVARIRFGRPRRGGEPREAEVAVHGLLAAWLKNGQIHEYVPGEIEEIEPPVEVFVEMPSGDSLSPRWNSGPVKECLGRARAAFGRKPEITVFSSMPSRKLPSWRRARTFYLMTSSLHRDSPVRSPELKGSVPLYALPLTASQREGIRFWMKLHAAHDKIWTTGSPLELSVYRQMVEPKSYLSLWAREISKGIEAATGKPTYHYLPRYHGHRRGEESRLCPSCGRKWAVPEMLQSARFSDFPFRCDRCRLVSHMGLSLDGARRARIGDWRAPLRRRLPGSGTT